MSFWESFWSIIVWFLWASIFIAYLMALFSVLADIVRDESLRGWAKAIWIVFLIFIPFLTALVYLIVRGDEMGERSATAWRSKRSAAGEPVAAAAVDPASQIEKAAGLLESGAITDEEFAKIKARVLAG